MSVNVSLIVGLAVAAFFGVVLIGAVIQGWEHRKKANIVSVLSWGVSILAIVAHQGFDLRSRHEMPVLRTIIDPALEGAGADRTALGLCRVLKKLRPELDLYLLSDQNVEPDLRICSAE